MRGDYCLIHQHDARVPQEKHHVWPLGYHGPNTEANKILICCNAHSDIHYYMEYLLKHGGVRPTDWRTYGILVRFWALSGYNQVMAYAQSLADAAGP